METEIGPLPAAAAEKAKKELFEDPETRPRKIQELRAALQAQPRLKSRLDDKFLLRFLRARKFDIDRAVKLVMDFYKIKSEEKELLERFLPSAMEKAMRASVSCMLPDRDKNGCRIFYLRPGQWNPDEMKLNDMFSYNFLLFEHFIREPETQVHGFIAINNLSGIGMKQARNLSPSYMKRMTSLLQDAFPARFKGFHIVNEPAIMDLLWGLMSPFLKEKTKSRFKFHGKDLSSLHQHFDPEVLPTELGGKKTLDTAWCTDQVKANEAYFEAQRQYSLSSVAALASDKGSDPGAGLQGSFRKLNVD